VRFNYSTFSHAAAVENTMKLFQAAGEAGIERIVHVSILNPSENSGLEYFRGKALLEKALIESGISYAILRPAVLFGKEDVLINNIAWLLRKFPVFAIPGDGKYRIQPIHVDDLAKLAVEQGDARTDAIIDAVGPETFTYRELVQEIASAIGLSRFLVSLPPSLVWLASLCIGLLVHDVLLTREELKGLIDNLLFADAPPVGEVRLSDWLRDNAEALGRRYANEVRRRENLRQSYDAL
jgi:NADH dehydrogenase